MKTPSFTRIGITLAMLAAAGFSRAQTGTVTDMPTPRVNVPAPIGTPTATPPPSPEPTPTPAPLPLGTSRPLPGTTPAHPVANPNSGGTGSTTLSNSVAPTNAEGRIIPSNSR